VASWLLKTSAWEHNAALPGYRGPRPLPEEVWDEICLVLDLPGQAPRVLTHKAGPSGDYREYRSIFETCISAWNGRSFPPGTDEDVIVCSGRIGITGSVDIYDRTTGTFILVRASRAPPHGIWASDRMRVTAYWHTLAETFPEQAATVQGLVAYVPDGIVRSHEPSARDHRALIRAVQTVRHINRGEVPIKPVNPPCTGCPYTDRCVPSGGRRLRDLF
jgi:CRISPR-associated exonuclease Cas4